MRKQGFILSSISNGCCKHIWYGHMLRWIPPLFPKGVYVLTYIYIYMFPSHIFQSSYSKRLTQVLYQPAILKRLRGLTSGSSGQHDHESKSCTVSFSKYKPHFNTTKATRKIDWCNSTSCSKSVEGLCTLLECQRMPRLIFAHYPSVRGGRSCE